MARWKSQQQIAEEAYASWKRGVYPQVKEAIATYLSAYHWNRPVAEDEQVAATSKTSLLARRLNRECIQPLLLTLEGREDHKWRLKQEATQDTMEPFYQVVRWEARLAERELETELSTRPVVEQGTYTSKTGVGQYVVLDWQERVLRCVFSEYVDGFEDMDNFEGGWNEKFAEPTEEEMQSSEYQRAFAFLQKRREQKKAEKKQAKGLLADNEW